MTSNHPVLFRALRRAMLASIGVLTFVGLAGLWGMRTQGQSLERLARGALPRAAAASAAREASCRFTIALLRFRAQERQDLAEARDALSRMRRELARLPLDGSERRQCDVLLGQLEAETSALEARHGRDDADHRMDSLVQRAQALEELVDALYRRIGGEDLANGEAALDAARRHRWYVVAGLTAGWLGALTTIAFALRRLQNPFQQVLRFLEAAADRDLSGELDASRQDELGALAGAADRLRGTLVGALSSLRNTSQDVAERGARLRESAAGALRVARNQLDGSAGGTDKARAIETALVPLESLTGDLRGRAEQAASSVQEILAMSEQVQSEMEGLCHRVEGANLSVQELDEASTRVAALTTQLGSAAQAVAASAAAIDRATETLRSGAREGKGLTGDVAERAAEGRASMGETLHGMARIHEAVDTAMQRFDRLGHELGRVGRVTQVIDDIAGRTNLLSLNAAIIAAQAGEQGRAFGVVATEIRTLAEKTAASTREIRAIVDGVAAGGRQAAEAIAEGVTRVEKGEEMVRKTGDLLEAIHDSAEHAAQRLGEIDSMAGTQAAEAARVADEIRQVSRGVVDIVAEVRAQEARTGEIRQVLAEVAELARHTVRATDEQSEGTELITKTVTAVSEVAEQVDAAIAQVGELLKGLRSEMEALWDRAGEELEFVERMETLGEGLAALAEGVGAQAGAFRLPAAAERPS